MLKRLPVTRWDGFDEEKCELANWIWNSHSWVEESPGYFVCKWCKGVSSGYTPITTDDNLCRENSAVKRLRDQQ